MPYPDSPFTDSFYPRIITNLQDDNLPTVISNELYRKTLNWLCTFPKITSYRVNTIRSESGDVLRLIRKYCAQIFGSDSVRVELHPSLDNVVIIHSKEVGTLKTYEKEAVVDVECASAILRGAHIYAPGVLGLISGSQVGDKVSIYADISKKCKRGLQKIYEDEKKLLIANGIVRMQRFQLFSDNIKSSGVAIEITDTISGCPPIGDDFLPRGVALLQNLPSILCAVNLDPKPGDVVLDMCASPGNKTTHIAELMNNEGHLVAIDKTPRKVDQLRRRCEEFGAKVAAYQADSTKIVSEDRDRNVLEGPPFGTGTFDRILLDAPCSVLGKRPQLTNRLSDKEIKSYVPLQRKLMESAVKLLKENGTLVYSTCTITLAENEGMVAWALRNFPCLELIQPKLSLGGTGWPGTPLSDRELNLVQRFGPEQEVDSIGFFFACFQKTNKTTL